MVLVFKICIVLELLCCTGNLGDVMKESVKIAGTYSRVFLEARDKVREGGIGLVIADMMKESVKIDGTYIRVFLEARDKVREGGDRVSDS